MTAALSREALTIASSRAARPRLLSLFDGTGSICKPFAEAGWSVQRLDLDGRYGATVVCDVRQWDYSTEPAPDVLFAGVPCTEFSIARTRGRRPRNFALADQLVATTWRIIEHFLELNPQMQWFIENPDSSLLWRRRVADPFPHIVRLDYCQYGNPYYRKRTKLATNSCFVPRPLCDPKTCAACPDGKRHAKTAQRGPCLRAAARVVGDDCTLDELHAYPPELAEAIFEYCQTNIWHVL